LPEDLLVDSFRDSPVRSAISFDRSLEDPEASSTAARTISSTESSTVFGAPATTTVISPRTLARPPISPASSGNVPRRISSCTFVNSRTMQARRSPNSSTASARNPPRRWGDS